jgi:hypothetical protein
MVESGAHDELRLGRRINSRIPQGASRYFHRAVHNALFARGHGLSILAPVKLWRRCAGGRGLFTPQNVEAHQELKQRRFANASVLALIDENKGTARPFQIDTTVTAAKIAKILFTNVERKTKLVTEETGFMTWSRLKSCLTINHFARYIEEQKSS